MTRYEVYAALLVVTAFVFVVTGVVLYLHDARQSKLCNDADADAGAGLAVQHPATLQGPRMSVGAAGTNTSTSYKHIKPAAAPTRTATAQTQQVQAQLQPHVNANATSYKSRFQLMQQDTLQDALVAPRPQIRSPLIVSHDLQYKLQDKKYTFQSQQRDLLQYPSPAIYRVQLLVPLRNVVAITLSNGVFPITEFNVNPYNNKLDIRVGATVYTVVLPEGEYTETTLAAGLQTAITSVGPPLALFTVTLDPLTGKIVVTNVAPFDLLFRTGPSVNESLWQVMGFLQLDYTTIAPALSITAPGVIDLSGTLAIDLFVEEIKDNIDSTDNAMARIDLQKFTPTSLLTYFQPPDNGVNRFFWPIARLQYLTFKFMVKYIALLPDGSQMIEYRPYMFNGRNHTMQLAITSKEYRSPHEDVVELDPQS